MNEHHLGKLVVATAAGCIGAVLAMPVKAEVTVGGFMTQTAAYGDYSGGTESNASLHFDTNAEVLFTATGETDGGLTVTARVELEGHSGGDQIDENWLSVEGGFGKLTLGGEDPALITHGYAGIAGGYGAMGYYDDTDSFTPVGGSIFPGGYKDAQGIRYSSPGFGGFSLGASYQPEFADEKRRTSSENDSSTTSVGATYTANLGSSSITIAGGVATYSDETIVQVEVEGLEVDTSNLKEDVFQVGGQSLFDLSFNWDDPTRSLGNQYGAGIEWTLGGNTLYLRTDVDSDYFGPGSDRQSYGVAYERVMGSLKIGIGYALQKTDNAIYSAGEASYTRANRDDDFEYVEGSASGLKLAEAKTTAVVAGVSYDLGGGASVGAALAWGEQERQRYAGTIDNTDTTTVEDEEVEFATDLSGTFSSKSIDGIALGAHIAFSF